MTARDDRSVQGGRPRRVMLGGIVVLYAVLGLAILAPESVYSGDIGVKYVQAQALARHRFQSLDASAVLAVVAAPDRIVVADDPFTAQLLFPLYYRKIILLADSPDLGTKLGTLILDQRLPGAILVSRHPESPVTLAPLRPGRRESRGRMSIQEWRR